MPKNNEFNCSMKNSSATIAPTRSEIRIPCIAAAIAAAVSIKRFLCRHSLTLTAALVTFLSLCRLADVSLPAWAAIVLVICASIGCVHSSMVILAEAEDFEREHGKGGLK